MKKVLIFLCVVGLALIFVAAALPVNMKRKKADNRSTGCGYRIIEFGVGINCKGDTVKLTRSNGFQQLAATEKVSGSGVR